MYNLRQLPIYKKDLEKPLVPQELGTLVVEFLKLYDIAALEMTEHGLQVIEPFRIRSRKEWIQEQLRNGVSEDDIAKELSKWQIL